MKKLKITTQQLRERDVVHQLTAIFWWTLGLTLFLALISFNPNDPTWNNQMTNAHKATNWLGLVGAEMSGTFMDILGQSSYWVVLFFYCSGLGSLEK